MKSLDSFVSSNSGAILLIGPPGVGKTTTCTQLPAPWICHTDDNIKRAVLAIRNSNGKLKADFKYDIPLRDAKDKPIPRELRYKEVSRVSIEAANDPSIKTLCFELTSLVDILLDEVSRQEGWKLADGVNRFNDDPFQIQGWQKFANLLKNFIITMKSTGKLVVFSAHVESKDDVNDDGKNPKILKYISCPGKMRETLAGMFDEVWLLEIEERTTASGVQSIRTLRTQPSGFREAALGLVSATQLGRKIDLDIPTLTAKLAQ